jgi:hypothetical protein
MKKILLTLTALTLGLLLITGCGGDDDNSPTDPSGGNNNGNTDLGTIMATLDGDAVDFSLNAAGTDEQPGWYVLTGGNQAVGQTIVITLPATGGQYTLGNPGDPAIFITYDGGAWMANSGTLTVSAASNDQITGTFSGTVEDLMSNSMDVTGGSFDVEIVHLP